MIFIICLFSLFSYSYVPTVESLLRNSGNPEVTTNGVEVDLNFKPIMQSSHAGASLASDVIKYKLLLVLFNQEKLKYAQLKFASTPQGEELVEKKYLSNLSPFSIKSSKENLDKGFFLGVISSLLINDGQFLVQFLKNYGAPLRINSQLLNKEKWSLYTRHKYYLQKLKSNPRGLDLVPPLRPEEELEKKNVEEILSRPMYEDVGNVLLDHRGKKLQWTIQADSFSGIVDYYSRQIQQLTFLDENNRIDLELKDYTRFFGDYFFPKIIYFKTLGGDIWEIEIKKVRHFNTSESDWLKKLSEWDSKIKRKETIKPPMML